MAYILWELAKNPESQTKLRAELDANVSAKGNADFTVLELESMPYLNAVIKVTHPRGAGHKEVNLVIHRKLYASTVPYRTLPARPRRTTYFLFQPQL